MNAAVPALGIIIDLALGILMWAAMLRFLLSMVMKEDSRAAPMRILNATVMPATRLVMLAAPRWVIERTGPLYLAFLVFILRYYVVPLIVGYDVASFAALPLEQLLLLARSEIGL
jgi:hypothetical protein